MMLPLGSCLRLWPLVYVAAYPVTGPVDFVRNNITGCLNHNIGQAALCALEFDRSKSRGQASEYTWEKASQIFLSYMTPVNVA